MEKKRVLSKTKQFAKSIWLFPILLTLVLLSLTALKINGSSMGIYNQFFYGSSDDPSLIFGKPRAIRSDEWVVNTQMAIAQSNAEYPEFNKNLGNGADMSLLVDAPYRDWTQFFKPHNWSFFILPFDYAFAFKWWVMGYFLILSGYFFTLLMLPGRKKIAVLLSLLLFFSPFVQWWYQFITLAPLYYTLFVGSLFMLLVNTTAPKNRALISLGLVYVLTCFALVQYPPFQIPCIFALLLFAVGYLAERKSKFKLPSFKKSLLYGISAGILAIVITAAFIYEKRAIVHTITNTAYPGERVVQSGGYDIRHLLAGSFSAPLQSDTRAAHYSLPSAGAINQSESSNFILIIPFLLLPSVYLFYRKHKLKQHIDFIMLSILVGFIGCIVWLTTPGLELVGKITLLDKVPQARLLIGIGLLNFISIIAFIRLLDTSKVFSLTATSVYSVGVWLVMLFIGWSIHSMLPLFLGIRGVIALSLIIPLVIFSFMRARFVAGLVVLLGLSIASTAYINPIYTGTAILTKNQLSSAIKATPSSKSESWIVEDSLVQSFAFINGKRSLTGIYEYPQKELWSSITPRPDPATYNRYAHVNFTFDRNPNADITPLASNSSADHFGILIEPCSDFLSSQKVKYIVTTGFFTRLNAPCATLQQIVTLPAISFHIYSLTF